MAKAFQLSPLSPFSLNETSNVAQKWEDWKEALECFVQGSGITDDKQKAILFHQAGMKVHHIFRVLTIASDTYEDAIKVLDEHFLLKKNVAYERHVFRQAYQSPSENMDAYLNRLKNFD